MKRLSWIIAAAVGLASPAFAHATNAYVTGDTQMFSGPDTDYPAIDRLEEGSEVVIEGCTDGWEWCDVSAYGERGWVPGYNLEFEYQDRWVFVPEYAAQYRIPIVRFSIQTYWDSWYRHRPFYYQRYDWYRWHPVHRHWPRPVNLPPPHPIHHPPVHHPIDYPPPYHHGQPVPHPVDYPPPYHHGQPTPHPVDYPPPYHHGQPTPNPVDHPPPYHPQPAPPRVVPMPHPVPDAPVKPAASSKDKDGAQDQRR